MPLRPLIPFVLAATASVAASVAAAGELELDLDLHLNPTERTPAEVARIAAITQPTEDFSRVEPFEANQAGAATAPASTDPKLFKRASANMDFDRRMDFLLGEALFEKLWVSSPASTKASDGLGPLYNARSCARCHPNVGRGKPPKPGASNTTSMFLRLSIPASPGIDDEAPLIQEYLAALPEPTYGWQLQDLSIGSHAPEGRLAVTYEEFEVALAGGEVVSLRAPTYTVSDLGHGPMHPDVMLSPRIAPQMIGLGLLEAIPGADIMALADPDDLDGDGISGRAQIVMSPMFGQPMLGRFGLKAGSATVYEQSAAAFSGDIGISTWLFPEAWGDCTEAQEKCRNAFHGDSEMHAGMEIPDEAMLVTSFYTENLAVPARRDVDDAEVLRGKQVFYESGCIACHQPKFVTHRLEDRPEQSFQLIWPYTDLLLHDMGDGLADNRPEARATGREWRTPPLWGIGLTETVSGHTQFLHDGRARSLLEAVLWHGGEAQPQKEAVITMSKEDRDALIRFLESL